MSVDQVANPLEQLSTQELLGIVKGTKRTKEDDSRFSIREVLDIWIEEKNLIPPNATTIAVYWTADRLYKNYKKWCKQNGYVNLYNKCQWGRMMHSRGFISKQKTINRKSVWRYWLNMGHKL